MANDTSRRSVLVGLAAAIGGLVVVGSVLNPSSSPGGGGIVFGDWLEIGSGETHSITTTEAETYEGVWLESGGSLTLEPDATLTLTAT